MWVFSL